MRNTLVSIRTFAVAAIALTTALTVAAQQGPPNPQELAGKTAEQAYQNIQVLKGVPADQVIPAMRVIAGSLGVGCNFCHVQGDFAKDDIQNKKTARNMISMMMDINKNNFMGRQQVTCYTCHNGSNDPQNTLTFSYVAAMPAAGGAAAAAAGPAAFAQAEGRGAPQGAPGGPQAEGAPQGPSADQIFASYIQALGGEQALRNVTSLTVTATREGALGGGGRGGRGGAPGAGRGPGGPGAGAPGPGAAPGAGRGPGGPPAPAQVEAFMKAPNLTVSMVHAANGMNTASGFDGTTAWMQDARGQVTDLSGDDETILQTPAQINLVSQAHAAQAADFYEPLNLSKEFMRTLARGTANIDNHEAYVVIGIVQQGQPATRFFFDTKTGLLLRKVTVQPTPVGNLPTQVDYDDYRNANGIKVPYLVRIATAPNQRVTYHIDNVQVNASIENSKFAKPESKASQ